MKTEINIQNLKEQFNLDYSELQQISDDTDTGFVRLIGYLSDYPVYGKKEWYLFAEIITINLATNKIYRVEKASSKNQDWVITNNYKVIKTQNGQPILNQNFNTELPVTLENSPFELVLAFDFYYGIRHSREANMSMPELWESAVAGDDMWGYFDNKEEHYSLLDVINIIWNQMQ